MNKKINLISLLRYSVLPVAATFVLLVSSAHGQWVLIDDFDNLTAGDAILGTTGPGAVWGGVATIENVAAVDPDCPTNIAMQEPGSPNPGALRAEFSDATTNIAAGATGTLFYRFRTPDAAAGTTDIVTGLTDNPTITNFNFKAGLRTRIVTTGQHDFDIRDGGSYEFANTLADNTWYSVWMVAANTNPGTFEVYLQSDTDTNFATQTQIVGNDAWDFRINGATDIVNVLFRNSNNAGGMAGNSVYFDDIYINPAAIDLSTPSGVGSCGISPLKGDVDLSGAVDFGDIPAFISVLQSGGFQIEADCDCSGGVDFSDIPAFITILQGG